MNIKEFSKICDLAAHTEIEKTKLITYFFHKTSGMAEIPKLEIQNAFSELHFHLPNFSRLFRNISASRDFVRSKAPSNIKLHSNTLSKFDEKYGAKFTSDEIDTIAIILPDELFHKAPTYLVKLKDQINACYEKNIFDGCAVLMRRLLEILLIQAYEKLGLENEIKDAKGHFKLLDGISNSAKTNGKLALSRNTKQSLDDFKKVGNFAAHKIHYTTRRGDIDAIKLDYRGSIEELMYKSGHVT